MLDMGFEPALNSILATVPPGRQTLFFSATWPREVQQVAQQYVVNTPAYLFVGDVNVRLPSPHVPSTASNSVGV